MRGKNDDRLFISSRDNVEAVCGNLLHLDVITQALQTRFQKLADRSLVACK